MQQMAKFIPNTIVIGAPKSGTTSLYHYLLQHPDIYLPEKKELHFFSHELLRLNANGPGDLNALKHICTNLQDYFSYFSAVNNESIVAEVSPSYLYYAQVSDPIYSSLGSIKIIVLLRNPIHKAFSQYMHLKRVNREKLSFFEALQVEEKRIQNGWRL